MSKNTHNKDVNLKFMCKALFSQMGCLTYYEVDLRSKSYIQSFKTHDISDIDVLGIKFFEDLSIIKIGSECKSGDSKALEELYKLIGVLQYYDLNKGYLIKSKIHQNARQVAFKNDIKCLTEPEIRTLLLGMGIDVDKLLKIEKAKYVKLSNAIKRGKKVDERLANYLKYEYWNKKYWKNIQNIFSILEKNTSPELFTSVDMSITDKYYNTYAIELLSISILELINDSMILNYSDIENSIINSLYGGSENLNERRQLFDLVSQVTGENAPFGYYWEEEFVSLCSRYSAKSSHSCDIPAFLQEIRENCFYDNKILIKNESLSKFSDITRKFVQDLVHFLIKNNFIQESAFKELMKL